MDRGAAGLVFFVVLTIWTVMIFYGGYHEGEENTKRLTNRIIELESESDATIKELSACRENEEILRKAFAICKEILEEK